ncbi:MAG: 2-C-methyl-D-erythritol 4-phosphate cytidylyltransferase [Nitrospirae bacterium]|nr:2-C-methyl-D-erythritol 4-phosphate cytidylyltransferase [Nitrospirota bacterium]
MNKKIIAIVPAAGLGKRFGAAVKKTFFSLNGAPLLIHALKRLHNEDCIAEIIPVLGEKDIESGFQLVKEYNLSKVKRIAPGGPERQDSIYNALKLLQRHGIGPDDIVLIHDGVRPFIPKGLIERLVSGLKAFDGVVPGVPVKETLKEVNEEGVVISTVNRARFRSIQTPQAFSFEVIMKAYDRAYAEGFYATDDAALVEKVGGKVKIIQGSPSNIKVTIPEDLEMVECLLNRENTIRR